MCGITCTHKEQLALHSKFQAVSFYLVVNGEESFAVQQKSFSAGFFQWRMRYPKNDTNVV